jgi:hypothetical protein
MNGLYWRLKMTWHIHCASCWLNHKTFSYLTHPTINMNQERKRRRPSRTCCARSGCSRRRQALQQRHHHQPPNRSHNEHTCHHAVLIGRSSTQSRATTTRWGRSSSRTLYEYRATWRRVCRARWWCGSTTHWICNQLVVFRSTFLWLCI